MVRLSHKVKRFFGRVGKGIKSGVHKVVKFLKGANEAYERGKQFVNQHQGDVEKAKELVKKHAVSMVRKLLKQLLRVKATIRKELKLLISTETKLNLLMMLLKELLNHNK